MEKYDSERLDAAERSGEPSKDSIKIRNALLLLDSKIKKDQTFSGNELRLFIKDMESRGLTIPDVPISTLKAAELRALTTAFNTKLASGTMPSVKVWTDAEMRKRISDQQAELDLSIEERDRS